MLTEGKTKPSERVTGDLFFMNHGFVSDFLMGQREINVTGKNRECSIRNFHGEVSFEYRSLSGKTFMSPLMT